MPKRASASSRRKARRVAIALANATSTAERQMVRDLRGIAAGVHRLFMDYLAPAMRERVGSKADAIGLPKHTGEYGKDIERVLKHVLPQAKKKAGEAHEKATATLGRQYGVAMKSVLPVGFQNLPSNVQAEALTARNNAIGFVEKATREYADKVREVFDDPAITIGSRWEDLRDKLMERGDVAESRAELIARDQTLKLNGAINKSRQQSAGLETYIWNTSGDERVRPEHEELDGQIFSWAAPPPPGHPGEDFQCRCIAVPVIPELADWQETDE